MHRRLPVHQEGSTVSFAVYLYPFEATTIGPAKGGENIGQVVVEGPGIEITQRAYPDEWQMVCEDQLWWISLDRAWLRDMDIQIPSNSTQYELAFLITAVNICVSTKVFFTRFARREYLGIIDNGEQRRPSSMHELVNVLERPLPNTVVIDGYDLTRVTSALFEDVLLCNEHTDLAKAVESYRAAIQSFHSEVHVRLLYSVCENALFTGNPDASEKDETIASISSLDEDEAEAWRHLVNRTKHPDEGTPFAWEDTFEDVPPPVEFRMREAANEAIRRQLGIR